MKQQFYLWLLCVAFLTAASPALLKAQEKITGEVNPSNNTLIPAGNDQILTRCPSVDIFKQYLAQDTAARRRWEESEAQYRMVMGNPNLRQQVNSGAALRTNSPLCGDDPMLVIPVVFHVVYDEFGDSKNLVEGLLGELLAEISINNFLLQSNIFLNSANIRLVKASRNFANATTTGFTKHPVNSSIVQYLGLPNTGDFETEATLKLLGLANFPQNNYLHVWLVDQIGQNVVGVGAWLGFGTFPFNPNNLQGIVFRSDAFLNGSHAIFVHELGHYLNLFHTFDHSCPTTGVFCCDNVNCFTDGDRVCDTPPDNNYDSCPTVSAACEGSQNNLNNLMDYGACIQAFTPGQITRMRSALIFQRPGLLTSTGGISGLDAGLMQVISPSGNVCSGSTIAPIVSLKNNGTAGTTVITSARIGYKIDGESTEYFENWGGSLPPNSTTDISFDEPPISLTFGWHNIEFFINQINGAPANSYGTPNYLNNDSLCFRFHYGTWKTPTPTVIAPQNAGVFFASGEGRPRLEWEPIPNAIYRVHISTVNAPVADVPGTGLLKCGNIACNTCQSTLITSHSTTNNTYHFTNDCGKLKTGTTYYWTVRASINGECVSKSDFSPVRSFSTLGIAPPSITVPDQVFVVNCPQTESAVPLSSFTAATPVTDAAKTLAFTNLIFGKSYSTMPTGSSAANPGFITGNFLQTYSGGFACGATSACSTYPHKGLDQSVGGSVGTVSLYSPISGMVVATGGSTGKICIYNADLGATFIFLHTTNIAVSPGDDVVRGTNVGRAGNTGASAAHVHSELRAGYKTAGSCPCSTPAADGVYDPRLVVDMLSVSTSSPTPSPALNFPADVATNVSIPVDFGWQQIQDAEYRIQVSIVNADWTPENGFGNDIRSCTGAPATLVVTVNTAQNNAFTWNDISGCFAPLPGTTYYWSVRAHTAVCGTSLYSPVRSFTTAPAAPLTVSPASMTFNATSGFGAQQTATLTGVTGPFTVTKNQTWISYNISGNNLIVYCASNTGTLSRYGTITITSGTQTATIQVRQSGTGGCTGGTQTGGTLTPTASWQSAPSMTGGKYVVMNVTQGTQYTFSLCSTNSGVAAYDSEITILDHLTPTFQHAFNQTGTFGCGDDAKLTWLAPITGTIRVLVHQNHCISNALATTLRYKTGMGKWDDETVVPNAPSLSLYPNPASTIVSLNFTTLAEAEEVLITLYDASGKAVFVEKNTALLGSNTFVLETAGFNPGVYMVTVQNTAGILTDKLVLIK